jgi:hypothetical protein
MRTNRSDIPRAVIRANEKIARQYGTISRSTSK